MPLTRTPMQPVTLQITLDDKTKALAGVLERVGQNFAAAQAALEENRSLLEQALRGGLGFEADGQLTRVNVTVPMPPPSEPERQLGSDLNKLLLRTGRPSESHQGQDEDSELQP